MNCLCFFFFLLSFGGGGGGGGFVWVMCTFGCHRKIDLRMLRCLCLHRRMEAEVRAGDEQ